MENGIQQNQKNLSSKIIIRSDVLKWAIVGVLAFVVLILVFGFGVFVGTKKAEFSYRWAENYHNNFAGPRMGFINDLREFPAGDFIEGHGSVGKIIKIDANNIIIQGRENTEKTIIVSDSTVIKNMKRDIKLSDLRIDNLITIIGSPNDAGQIEAKLIRVMPEPPMSFVPQDKNFNKNQKLNN